MLVSTINGSHSVTGINNRIYNTLSNSPEDLVMLTRKPYHDNSTCVSLVNNWQLSSYQIFANKGSDTKSKQSAPHQSKYSKRVKLFRSASIFLAGLLADQLFAQLHCLFESGKVLFKAAVRTPLGRVRCQVTSGPLQELHSILTTALWWLNE